MESGLSSRENPDSMLEVPIVRHEAACSPVVCTQPWVPPHESTGMCVESNFGVQSSQDNVPSCKGPIVCKDNGWFLTPIEPRARGDGMTNVSEPFKSIVTSKGPKVLIGLSQKGK
jgi:hypothetical protein